MVKLVTTAIRHTSVDASGRLIHLALVNGRGCVGQTRTKMLCALAMMGSAAHADVPGDPQGSGVIIGAVNWLEGTLLGTVATVVAVIAIAAVGFMMLTGRINWRHGAVVVLGCFIVFGAASIVAGIRSAASGG